MTALQPALIETPAAPTACDIWNGFVEQFWKRPYKTVAGRGYGAHETTSPNPNEPYAYMFEFAGYRDGVWTIRVKDDWRLRWAEMRMAGHIALGLRLYVGAFHNQTVSYRVRFCL